jgi:hypothetical protein
MGHKTQLSRGIPDIGTKTIGGRVAPFVSLPLSVESAQFDAARMLPLRELDLARVMTAPHRARSSGG